MTDVLICSYLEPALIGRIERLDPRLRVHSRPDLIPAPRYPADHGGAPFTRAPAQQAEWEALLGQAEVLFDFDATSVTRLPELAPKVRWVQATSAGIGQFVRRHDYGRMNAVFTTASGVHARPLAEYAIMSILQVVKQAGLAARQQAEHRWERFATTELSGATLAVIGLGRIGLEVARLARAFDMRVTGVKRNPAPAETLGVDRVYPWEELHACLGEADFVVLACPHTPETENLMDTAAFAAMKPGATLVNVARGAVVNEDALIFALNSGRLAHAALDVTAHEPLPPESPLWTLPGVSIYPHSASTNDRENERLVDLFCDNLTRYLAGEPLRNVLDLQRMY